MTPFDAEAYPIGQRADAWQTALTQLPMTTSLPRGTSPAQASISGITSRQGCRFLNIKSIQQTLSWQNAKRGGDLWLSLLLQGAGRLATGDAIREGDLCIGTMAAGGSLTLTDPFHLLFVILPMDSLDLRLRRMTFDGGKIATGHGMGAVLTGFLETLANTIALLGPEQMYPLELALSEMLTAAVAGHDATTLPGGIDRRKSTFQRLLLAIEASLADPEFSLAALADSEGLSVRTVQKLFHAENLSFGQYVRRRRLQRAAQDLLDPLHVSVLVAGVGFRWGFADPAHFNRVFREQYGVTPGVFRRQNSSHGQAEAARIVTRGHPKTPPPARRNAAAAPAPSTDHGDTTRPDKTSGAAARHHHIAANERTIHWGYFSRSLAPVLTVQSGDIVTIETLTQHASDDHERMVQGDPGAENIMAWTATHKTVDRRGAGPMDASIYGRGAGEGFGVHICTGPIAIEGALPGDILEIEILDIVPRPSQSPAYRGRSFGSNVAVWWGYHYKEMLTEPRPREVVTLYELETHGGQLCAHAVYNFRWTPQRDPYGVVHPTIDYPGIPVDHSKIEKNTDIMRNLHIPVRPHFGIICVAPDYAGILDSTPPSAFGGNIDNWRLGAGSRLYLPVAVAGALLSVGDPHAAQGDGEVSGTAIECSLTGTFRLRLHRRAHAGGQLRDLTYPLIETPDAWIVQGFSHPNYLAELGETAQSEVYKRSSLDAAMRDAFRKARRLLMTGWGLSEDEAVSLLSVAVDFGITQVVDGNLGVHAIIPKSLFGD
jgi:acetamidase/formamidase/AraC-like DNA-binding protein